VLTSGVRNELGAAAAAAIRVREEVSMIGLTDLPSFCFVLFWRGRKGSRPSPSEEEDVGYVEERLCSPELRSVCCSGRRIGGSLVLRPDVQIRGGTQKVGGVGAKFLNHFFLAFGLLVCFDASPSSGVGVVSWRDVT